MITRSVLRECINLNTRIYIDTRKNAKREHKHFGRSSIAMNLIWRDNFLQ